MSIKGRLALLLGVLLVAFLSVLLTLRQMERSRADEMREESMQAGQLELQQWINQANQPLQRFVRDFGEWKEMASYIRQPDPTWADANLKENSMAELRSPRGVGARRPGPGGLRRAAKPGPAAASALRAG